MSDTDVLEKLIIYLNEVIEIDSEKGDNLVCKLYTIINCLDILNVIEDLRKGKEV